MHALPLSTHTTGTVHLKAPRGEGHADGLLQIARAGLHGSNPPRHASAMGMTAQRTGVVSGQLPP
jgi:hypothetical protein